MSGQIILVNGTSGSGKSTTCEEWVKRAGDFWLLYGIDHFMAGTFPAAFGHHGPRAHEGIEAVPRDGAGPDGPLRWRFGPQGTRAMAIFHEWIAAAAREGANIIVDHLLMQDPAVLQDCIWRLDGLPVLLVTLKPPYAVLTERVASRSMDKKLPVDLLGADAARKIVDRLSRLRPWFYDAVYANAVSDLEIDTLRHGPAEVCALVAARLEAGPGTAFARLREQFPQPGAAFAPAS
ncbi:MAG: AAA family ATPase [Sphingomonadales bacterium]|nr:AAA family ATPase [Sphingomonadales bacterium]